MTDIENAIAAYEQRGYRLDMLMPADAPRVAVVSKGAEMLRLSASATGVEAEPFTGLAHAVVPRSTQEFVISRATAPTAWADGRAGMRYRDLIPGRLGGRYIASHIKIDGGGPVGDYVHHHRVRFQMIYVHKGWVRVVYEDQGEPFVMHEGDCVLQPPHIRHRVLESSNGLEVIEIGSPAEHETFRDHDLALPTKSLHPDRDFDGQRFARHVASTADWHHRPGCAFQDTGIAAATNGAAGVRILKPENLDGTHRGDFLFLMVLAGSAHLSSRIVGTHTLETGDTCVLPTATDYTLAGTGACRILEVALPSAQR